MPDQQPILFLPQLVEYLQDKFRLPPNLPMVYEYGKGDGDKAIMSWYSPMSSSADETRLSVEVVGIQTDGDDTIPHMAMVAVHKIKGSAAVGAPMMTNFFADSEKKIIRALDRGLDQFSDGKIKGLTTSVSSPSDWVSVTLQDGAEGEYDASRNDDDTVDATTGDVITPTIEKKETVESIVDKSENTEFAVEAAKQVAAKKQASAAAGEDYAVSAAKKQRKQKDGEFAVEAAKKMAKKVKGEAKQNTSQKKEPITEQEPTMRTPSDAQRKLSGPSWSISSPKSRKKQQREQKDEESSSFEISEVIQDIKVGEDFSPRASSSTVVDAEIVPIKQSSSTFVDSDRKLNLKVVDDKDADPTKFPFAMDPIAAEENEDDSDEVRKAKEAQRIMAELAEESKDMTAEELLKDVLKFGEEQKKEEEVGTGFVSGAFEKAKELLRERKQQRQELHFKEVNQKSTGDFKLDIADPDDTVSTEVLTPEEELKRIFQAGERLAERRIELSIPGANGEGGRELTEEQDEQVDELLAKEKTISTHARTLDEELAELEVRINRNPDEDMDGPRKNPIFDVLSGPEVYNPNVDPETAVNWPGALPGTKKIRLPKELDDAVKQANFAADVIMKMREETVEDDETGEVSVNYFVGDRPLSHEEVLNLKTVVAEGVKLGLLNDPVEFMAERSRLQILVDELSQQPDERFKEIAENYMDLLLSENFVELLKERLTEMATSDMNAMRQGNENELKERHEREREILGQLVVYAQLLLKEARALGAQLEAQQIEVIRSICKVAMDPSHVTEEETAGALTDAVRDMRPLFDDAFVAYIKFAVAEEEGRLARSGVLDDPEHTQWLMVLQIVQQGVYAEIAKGINRYIEHIWYVLRMETRQQRRSLLAEIINVMPTLDVRPFVQVVDNIASSLGDAAKGDADPLVLGEMTNKLLQLHRDVQDLLPPERINEMAKDADEWAAKQKQRLLEQRNLTKKRLEQARETEHLTEAILKRAGEVERFD